MYQKYETFNMQTTLTVSVCNRVSLFIAIDTLTMLTTCLNFLKQFKTQINSSTIYNIL